MCRLSTKLDNCRGNRKKSSVTNASLRSGSTLLCLKKSKHKSGGSTNPAGGVFYPIRGNWSCRQRPRPPSAAIRGIRAAESRAAAPSSITLLSGAESCRPPTGAAPALARNAALIGLLSTSATEPNAGGSLSRPPVVHYGPHSALIRANPV